MKEVNGYKIYEYYDTRWAVAKGDKVIVLRDTKKEAEETARKMRL